MPHRLAVLVGLLACNGATTTDTSSTDASDTTDASTTDTPTTDTSTASPLLPDTPFASGTRLIARATDAGGEADAFRGWHDTQLGIDCRVTMDETHALRCVPQAITIAYLDDACTEPVFEWFGCDDDDAPPAIVGGALASRCIGPPAAIGYDVGAAVTTDHVYTGNDCVYTDLFEDRTVYRASPRPSTDFVRFDATHVALDGGLGAWLLETADGAHHLAGIVATEPGQTCTPMQIGADRELCIPGDLAYDYGFLHLADTCDAETVAYSICGEQCEPPSPVLRYRHVGACNRFEAALHELEGTVDPELVYRGTPDTCAPSPSGTGTFWAVGGPTTTEPPALSRTFVGSGRLQQPRYTTPAGIPLTVPVAGWHDTELDVTCYELETATHGRRCLPETHAQNIDFGYYQDAACTEALLSWSDDPCITVDPPALYATFTNDGCTATPLTNVRAVGGAHDGPVYRRIGSDCTPEEVGPGDVYLTVGGAVSLDDYAPLTRR